MDKVTNEKDIAVDHLQNADLPVLPLRDIVVFPKMIVPIFVGRGKSISALEYAAYHDNYVALLTQKDPLVDDPMAEDLYTNGTVAKVLQLLRLPDGTVKALIEGARRMKVEAFLSEAPHIRAKINILKEPAEDNAELSALSRLVISDFEKYSRINRKIPVELISSISQIDDPSRICDLVVSNLEIKLSEKQEMLELLPVGARLEKAVQFMEGETSILNIEKRIRTRVKRQMEKTQREYYLQ